MTMTTTTTTTPAAAHAATLADVVAPPVTAADAMGDSPRAGRSARRSFTAAYKREIVAEYDSAPVGSNGAML